MQQLMSQAPAMMIRKLHVESFGCLKDATVDLEPLTVFVGPNDSGKSMLLQALTTLAGASILREGWRGVFPERQDLVSQTFNGRDNAIRFGLAGELGAEKFEYDVEVSTAPGYSVVHTERLQLGHHGIQRANQKLDFRGAEGKTFQKDVTDGVHSLLHADYLMGGHLRTLPEVAELFATVIPLFDAVRAMRFFSLRPDFIRAPTGPGAPFESSGFGLPTAIAELMLRDRDAMDRVEKALARAMPHVRRVQADPRQSQDGLQYDIEILTRSGARVPSARLSDGLLLYLGYLYLVLGPNPASVLLVEEPETGIHFGLLRSVMKLFRDMTTGAHGGPPTQILLTTHSPMLLNLVEPREIRVVERGDDGATRVSRFTDAPDLDKLLDYQGPGEVWVNQGEEYLTRRKAPAP
jgi:predicted ATPase